MSDGGQFAFEIVPNTPKQGRVVGDRALSVVVHRHHDVCDEVVLLVVSVFIFVKGVAEGHFVEQSDVFGEFVDGEKERILGVAFHQEVKKGLFDQIISERIVIIVLDSFFIRDFLCGVEFFGEVLFVEEKIGADILFVFVEEREKADVSPFVG